MQFQIEVFDNSGGKKTVSLAAATEQQALSRVRRSGLRPVVDGPPDEEKQPLLPTPVSHNDDGMATNKTRLFAPEYLKNVFYVFGIVVAAIGGVGLLIGCAMSDGTRGESLGVVIWSAAAVILGVSMLFYGAALDVGLEIVSRLESRRHNE